MYFNFYTANFDNVYVQASATWWSPWWPYKMVATNQKSIQGLDSYSARFRNVIVHNDDNGFITNFHNTLQSFHNWLDHFYKQQTLIISDQGCGVEMWKSTQSRLKHFQKSFDVLYLTGNPVSRGHVLVQFLPLGHQLVHGLDVVVHVVTCFANPVPVGLHCVHRQGRYALKCTRQVLYQTVNLPIMFFITYGCNFDKPEGSFSPWRRYPEKLTSVARRLASLSRSSRTLGSGATGTSGTLTTSPCPSLTRLLGRGLAPGPGSELGP